MLAFQIRVLDLLRDGMARSKLIVIQAVVHSFWVLRRVFLASSYELNTARFKYVAINLASNLEWESLER